MKQMVQDILKLSIPERILLVEAIWDSITEKDELVEISSETRRLLDKRLAAHKNNPEEGSSWNEVKGRIKKQF